MTIVNEAVKAPTSTAKRVTYGIDVIVGSTHFNEYALHESEAKTVNRLLTLNGDKPLPPTKDGVVYARKAPSAKQSEFAEMEAAILAGAAK